MTERISKNVFKKGLMFIMVLGLALLAACGSSDSDDSSNEEGASSGDNSNFSIGSPPAGITFHTMGVAFASLVSDNSEMSMNIRPYNGPTAYLPLLNDGEVDFAVDTDYNSSFAFHGLHEYEENKNIRTVIMGTRFPIAGMAVRGDAGIETISDLKGKRVASEYAGDAGQEGVIEAQLLSGGLTWDDVERIPVADVSAGVDALREGRVDATFSGNPPNAIFVDVDNALPDGIHALNWGDLSPDQIDEFPQDIADKMFELVPGLKPAVYSGGGFVGEDEMLLTDYSVLLLAGEHVTNEDIYSMMETVWEEHEGWKSTMLESWTPEGMTSYMTPVVPYHEGAVEFYKDKGVWNDELEAQQQELLEQVE